MSRPPGSVLVALGIQRGARLDLSHSIGLPDDHLAASCWCQRGYVVVTADDVRTGRTFPCGRPDCLAQPRAKVA